MTRGKKRAKSESVDYEAILASEGLAPISLSTRGWGGQTSDGFTIHRNWKYLSHRAPYYQAVYEVAVSFLLQRRPYASVMAGALLAEGAATDEISRALNVSHGTAHNLRVPYTNLVRAGAQ